MNDMKIYHQGENVIHVAEVGISQGTALKEEEGQILEDVTIVKEDIEVVQEVTIIIIGEDIDLDLLQDHQVEEENIGKEIIEEVGAKAEIEIGIGVKIGVEVEVKVIEILEVEVEIKIKVKILEIMMINH
jgi:hypothetical protein